MLTSSATGEERGGDDEWSPTDDVVWCTWSDKEGAFRGTIVGRSEGDAADDTWRYDRCFFASSKALKRENKMRISTLQIIHRMLLFCVHFTYDLTHEVRLQVAYLLFVEYL